MSLIYLALVTIAEVLIGIGILSLSGVQMRGWRFMFLSLIVGMGTVSLIPFTLDMLHIPLTGMSIFSVIAAFAITAIVISRNTLKNLQVGIPKLRLYDLPWLGILGLALYYAIFRSTAIPLFPRDVMAGAEPIAEYALKEHTFINSVFEQDFSINNNPFKSIYLPALQLIDKLIGFEYGKIWVVILSFSFIFFIYTTLKRHVHSIIAGFICVTLLTAPEFFGFTFLILYDLSNMIFFFLSIYFLRQYFNDYKRGLLILSAYLMFIATYIRPETLMIAGVVMGYMVLYLFFAKKRKLGSLAPALIVVVSAISYFITSHVFLNYYVPVEYDVSGTINDNLTDLSPLFTRFSDMITVLTFSERGYGCYGYFFLIAFILLGAELLIYRKLTKDGKFWLGVYFFTFLGIAIMGYILPLADLLHTTKRALLKAIPVMIMYMANNQVLKALSEKMTFSSKEKVATAKANSPQPKSGKSKAKKGKRK